MNVRLTFLLVAVLLLFGGTFLVVQFTGGDEGDDDPPWLYRMNESDIARIEASNQERTVVYVKRQGSYKWFIEGGEDNAQVPVYQQKWSGTTLLLSGPQVDRVLSESIDNPASYGLDPPATTIKVTSRSGLGYELHLGNSTPNGKNQYARLAGNPQLFTVVEIWAKVVNRLVNEPPIPRPYFVGKDDSGNEASVVHIGIQHQDQTLDYQMDPQTEEWSIWTEEQRPVAEEPWAEVLPQLNDPPIAWITSDTIDDPASYGLDPPRTWVRVTVSGEEPQDFLLGDLTPDGQSRYGRWRGENQLFTVPVEWAETINMLATDPLYAPASDGRTASPG